MEMLQRVWKQHLRPRAVVGYGVKIFLPSPPNYVTRSPGCFCYVDDAVLTLISSNLHKEGSEVLIKTRSIPASLSIKGQATQHTTVEWSTSGTNYHNKNFPLRLVLKERLRRTRKRSITTLSS